VYGYCPSYTNSPTNCLSCWNFYFSYDDTLDGAWHSDCDFQINSDDDCNDDIESIEYEWPEYICITDNTSMIYDGYNVNVDFNEIMGGYQINSFITELSGVPYWSKPANDYFENETYIYYDSFYGYWQIGDKLHVEATLFCMQDSGDYLPTHCKFWYDYDSNNLGNSFIYSQDCTEDDILGLSTGSESMNHVSIIILLLVLGIIACVIAAFFYYKYNQTNNGKGQIFPATKGIGNSGTVELGDDVDKMGLVNNTRGGFNMTPLNVEGNGTINDDDDDDDEELTVDAQQNAIVDDEDDEEQLIGNTAGDSRNEDNIISPDPDVEDENENESQPIKSIMDE